MPGQPRNTDLRRAVSAAYYALFHHLTMEGEEAAERLSRSKTREIQRLLAENPAVPERIRVVAAMRAEAFH